MRTNYIILTWLSGVMVINGCGSVPVPKVKPVSIRESPLLAASVPLQSSIEPISQSQSSNTELSPQSDSQVIVDDYITQAIQQLQQGQINKAIVTLQSTLNVEPGNAIAKDLLAQIEKKPNTYFSTKSYFDYETKLGDSLVALAQKFLNNPLQFHILGKLNNIIEVSQLRPGMTLKIPDIGGNADEKLGVIDDSADSHIQIVQPTTSNSNSQDVYDKAKRFYDKEAYESVIAMLSKSDVEKYYDHRARDLLVLAYTRYADLLAGKEKLSDAQKVLEKALDNLPNNQDLRRQLTYIKKQRDVDGYMQTALTFYQEGKPDKAYELYLKVLNLEPNNKVAREYVVLIKAPDIEKYFKDAMQHYRHQELQQAITLWDKVIFLDPGHELARLYRARAIELQQRIENM